MPVPADADEVSAQAAAATQLLALLNAAHTELARTGNTLVDIARIYAETDAAAARRLRAIRPEVGFRLAGWAHLHGKFAGRSRCCLF